MIRSIMLLVLLVLVTALGILFFLGLQQEPAVSRGQELTPEAIARARALIQRHRSGPSTTGQQQSSEIREDDLNLAVNYLLSKLPVGDLTDVKVDLEPGSATLTASTPLTGIPLRPYLNLSLSVSDQPEGIRQFSIGTLTLPGALVKPLLPAAAAIFERFDTFSQIQAGTTSIRSFHFDRDRLTLVYQWSPALAEQLKTQAREVFLNQTDRSRLQAYGSRLDQATAAHAGQRVSLTELMRPVFSLAGQRSDLTKEPIDENRAAILVLAMYAAGKPLSLLTGHGPGKSTSGTGLKPTLKGRQDLAKHFLLSAAIAAASDPRLSNVAGLYKELDDSRGGSGFSFADLAADLAGVRFAQHATATPVQAGNLQEYLSQVRDEAEFMPELDSLPEGLQEAAFRNQYRNRDNDAYQQLTREIENRISRCALFR